MRMQVLMLSVSKILSVPLCWRTSVWKRSALMTTMSPSSFQCTEVKAASSRIIQSFLGKDSPRTSLFSSSLAVSGFRPCGGGLSWEPRYGLLIGLSASPKPPLNPCLDPERHQGGALLWAPHQLMGPAGLPVPCGNSD